jgi:hypothetical protein
MRTSLFTLLLSLPAFCHAEPAPSWDLHQLMQGMAQIKESRATFTEQKFLKILKQPLESSGTLLYQAPDHLEKHTLVPKVEILVLHQGELTIDIKARNIKRTLVLQDYPAVWAFVESIRSTLAGDLPTLERFFKIELEGNSAVWKMRLLPIETKTRKVVSEIRFVGNGNKVNSIDIFEANGDHSLMKVIEDTQ